MRYSILLLLLFVFASCNNDPLSDKASKRPLNWDLDPLPLLSITAGDVRTIPATVIMVLWPEEDMDWRYDLKVKEMMASATSDEDKRLYQQQLDRFYEILNIFGYQKSDLNNFTAIPARDRIALAIAVINENSKRKDEVDAELVRTFMDKQQFETANNVDCEDTFDLQDEFDELECYDQDTLSGRCAEIQNILDACQRYQMEFLEGANRIGKIVNNVQMMADKDRTQPENWLVALGQDMSQYKIEILPDNTANVAINHFGPDRLLYTTADGSIVDAFYDPSTEQLHFTMKEKDSDGHYTGFEFYILAEKQEMPEIRKVRFKGPLEKRLNGEVLRRGQVKIDMPFSSIQM